MDTDERDIFQFLKIWGAGFTAPREISRRAGSKRMFHNNPDWAKPILLRMEERGILESDLQGRFRIKPVGKQKSVEPGAAPDVAQILAESGVAVETGVAGAIAADDYYEKL